MLCLEAAAGPGNYRVEFEVVFKGMGFEHSLGWCSFSPTNQNELETFICELMGTVKGLENEMLPKLDACYPETPEWYFL